MSAFFQLLSFVLTQWSSVPLIPSYLLLVHGTEYCRHFFEFLSTPFLSSGLESSDGSGDCALALYDFGSVEDWHVCILLGYTCPYSWSFFLMYPGMEISTYPAL